MVFIEGGEFTMGSERFYPEERPVRRTTVASYWIDETPVTNAAFARFVQATGYVTVAQRRTPEVPCTGSAVFVRPTSPVNLGEPSRWWEFRAGACWCRPLGSGSDLEGLQAHPVVHVALEDAAAYAAWAGKHLPTEAEWEFAARGGLDGAEYAWGNELTPDGLLLANYWQGAFPVENTLADGWERTSPVRAFAGNGHGLYDMIGNVWEWTADAWSLPREKLADKPPCCSARSSGAGRHGVLKGGSHLCAPNYCQRYRPAARQPQPVESTTGHIGFRCVQRR